MNKQKGNIPTENVHSELPKNQPTNENAIDNEQRVIPNLKELQTEINKYNALVKWICLKVNEHQKVIHPMSASIDLLFLNLGEEIQSFFSGRERMQTDYGDLSSEDDN